MITVIACGNAAGEYLPPHFVFPGKTRRKLDGYDIESTMERSSSIKGANFSVSDSGWTKDGIAKLWFTETFLKNIGPSRPQLLICDGHGSHNNVEFVELAKQNDIIIIELPSHTSNWTQPFDRTVFKSLKSHWNTAIDDFIKGTGVAVGHKQFLRLFSVAWQASLTPTIIKNGFAATGIYPFNPNAIPNDAYATNICVDESLDDAPESATNPVMENLTLPSLPSSINAMSNVEDAVVSDSSPSVENACQMDVSFFLQPISTQEDDPLYGLILDSSTCENQPIDDVSCTTKDALDIIESTLSSEQKLKFKAALISGTNTKLEQDPLFQTWKHYTQSVLNDEPTFKTTKAPDTPDQPALATRLSKPSTSTSATSSAVSIANEIFPIPKPKSKSTKKRNDEYFVITANEILNQKRKAIELKVRQAEAREQNKNAMNGKRKGQKRQSN